MFKFNRTLKRSEVAPHVNLNGEDMFAYFDYFPDGVYPITIEQILVLDSDLEAGELDKLYYTEEGNEFDDNAVFREYIRVEEINQYLSDICKERYNLVVPPSQIHLNELENSVTVRLSKGDDGHEDDTDGEGLEGLVKGTAQAFIKASTRKSVTDWRKTHVTHLEYVEEVHTADEYKALFIQCARNAYDEIIKEDDISVSLDLNAQCETMISIDVGCVGISFYVKESAVLADTLAEVVVMNREFKQLSAFWDDLDAVAEFDALGDEAVAPFIKENVTRGEWKLALKIVDDWCFEALRGWYVTGGPLSTFEDHYQGYFESIEDYWHERLSDLYSDIPETLWSCFDFSKYARYAREDISTIYKSERVSDEVHIYSN